MAKSIDLTGEKIGRLLVLERAEDQYSPSGRKKKMWKCLCDCGNEKIASHESLLKWHTTSCGCKLGRETQSIGTPILRETKDKAGAKSNKQKQKRTYKKDSRSETYTAEEKKEWDELYEYVKVNVMGYNENLCLSDFQIKRLQGLRQGKYMANRNTDNKAKYPFSAILNTFKFCKLKISNAISTNNFANDQHKFNYIMKIVEQNLNNVYMRMLNAEKVKKEAESRDIHVHADSQKEYKPKQKNVDRFDDLW